MLNKNVGFFFKFLCVILKYDRQWRTKRVHIVINENVWSTTDLHMN